MQRKMLHIQCTPTAIGQRSPNYYLKTKLQQILLKAVELVKIKLAVLVC